MLLLIRTSPARRPWLAAFSLGLLVGGILGLAFV